MESNTSTRTLNGTDTSDRYVESAASFPPVSIFSGLPAEARPRTGGSIRKTTSVPTSISMFRRVSLEEYRAPGILSSLYTPTTRSPEKYPDSSFCAKPSAAEAAKTESARSPLSIYTTEKVLRARSSPDMETSLNSTSIVNDEGPHETATAIKGMTTENNNNRFI